ncbi:hypothetical protein C2E23DRAFT_886679 [Lenzites betulinus]|nr:hypothetical protein C2E23DRAFT_886679 [Lenzites betulinus]
MQFTAVFAALAAFAVTQVCLDGYRNGNWNGEDCGGRGWFKGSHDYKNPDNCWDACAGLLVQAINQGASDVECDDVEGGARCWIGFH